jgi:predicted dehydrogenase
VSPNTKSNVKSNRRLRLGMVGGGPGGFIGAVHRIAARLDDRFELVAAALSSDPARARSAAIDLYMAPDRAYGSFAEMASAEAARPDRIDAVSIVTPNHLHYPAAKAFLEAGINVICDKPLTTTLEDAHDLATW